jgi:hypothetical protein
MIKKISDDINKKFQDLFITKNNEHPIFKDLKKVYELSINYREHMKNNIKKTVEYKQISIPDGITINPVYDVLTKDNLIKLEKEMKNVINFKKILELVTFMSNFVIRTNIKNEEHLYEHISDKKEKKDTINVMIIGSGPVGLFLGCYLSLYYNDTSMNNSPKVNVVIYDSRIETPGFRKPYNRQRVFATSSKYLSLIIRKLYCWNNNENIFMVNIFLLEYALYTIANLEYNIPIIYEDYDWDDYKKIIEKGKFDVVFDCTGGKLSHDAIKNIDTKWLDKYDLYNKTINRELEIDINRNLVLLKNDSKHIVNYYYGSMTLYNSDSNDSLTFYDKYDIDIMNKEDLIYFNTLKNKYYTFKETINIIKGITDDDTRNFLYTMINNNDNKYLIKFDVWGIYIRHAIKISDVFKVNNRDILFIGQGDTIFHSHFITGAGLNRTLDFAVKCANMISNII